MKSNICGVEMSLRGSLCLIYWQPLKSDLNTKTQIKYDLGSHILGGNGWGFWKGGTTLSFSVILNKAAEFIIPIKLEIGHQTTLEFVQKLMKDSIKLCL